MFGVQGSGRPLARGSSFESGGELLPRKFNNSKLVGYSSVAISAPNWVQSRIIRPITPAVDALANLQVLMSKRIGTLAIHF